MNFLSLVLWFIAGLLGLFGSYVITMNWLVFVNNHVLHKKWTSAIPVIGGLSLGLAVLLIPLHRTWLFCWLPLLLDWGAIPIILVSMIVHLKNRHQKK